MHHDMLLMYIMRAISADTSHPLLAHLFQLHALVLRHLARVLSALGCPRTIPRQTESDMHIVQLSHLILHASVWHAYCTAITLHFACLFFQRVTPSQGPLLPPGAPHPGGASASAVSASIVCAPSCSTWCGTTSSLKAGAGTGSVWHAR